MATEDTVARRYIKELPVRLTDAEKLAKVRELLEHEEEQADIAEEAKEEGKQYKDQIADLQKQIDTLKRHLRSGTEPRQVEVEEQRDWLSKSVRTVRLDTGEVISERAMRQDELQTELPGSDGDADVWDLETGKQLGVDGEAAATEGE